MLGGWRDDKTLGRAGLTAAGLLMFGRWPALPDAFPLYFVDYQEQSGKLIRPPVGWTGWCPMVRGRATCTTSSGA